MGLTQRGKKGIWQHFRRVPKRFEGIDHRVIIRTSLNTSDLRLAKIKAAQIEIDQDLLWEATLAGKDHERKAAFYHLKAVSEARGVPYLPARNSEFAT